MCLSASKQDDEATKNNAPIGKKLLLDTASGIVPTTARSTGNNTKNKNVKGRAASQGIVQSLLRSLGKYDYDDDYCWVSPFTPERMDPRVLMKNNPNMSLQQAKKQINDQFPTKSELRNAIPAHCFHRSVWRSMSFLIRDIIQGAIVLYITHQVVGLSATPPASWSSWVAWRTGWFVYSIAMTFAVGGLWVIGHECGHSAFSPYPWVNGLVGWTVHSFLLVPYFTWAFSHAKHHRRTNDLVDGETHIPPTAEDMGVPLDAEGNPQPASTSQVIRKVLSAPLTNYWHWHAKAEQLVGDDGFAILSIIEKYFLLWPMYLLGILSTGKTGADGKPIPKGTFPDHFRPHSRLIPPKMVWKVIASDVGIAITLSTLAYCIYQYGFNAVYFYYWLPYMNIQAFLVFTTWLQHTDPTVPHFDADNWTWIKGAIAGTIDRPLGPVTNYASHNISSTHIVHHLFHQIPHYHAVEATQAIRAYLEPKGLYNYDPIDLDHAVWKVAKNCHFVKSITDGVQYYQSCGAYTAASSTGDSIVTEESNLQDKKVQ